MGEGVLDGGHKVHGDGTISPDFRGKGQRHGGVEGQVLRRRKSKKIYVESNKS